MSEWDWKLRIFHSLKYKKDTFFQCLDFEIQDFGNLKNCRILFEFDVIKNSSRILISIHSNVMMMQKGGAEKDYVYIYECACEYNTILIPPHQKLLGIIAAAAVVV